MDQTSHTPERLAYMAGQIVRNLTHEDDPVRAAAGHIASFWTPAMIAQLRESANRLQLPEQVPAVIGLIQKEKGR